MIAASRLRKGSATAWTVPLLEEDWEADYSDICDLALRDGRVGVAEAYRANSGDSWRSFRGRHGDCGISFDWAKWREAERRRLAEAKRYEAERQAREAARRHERQVAAKLEADRQWWDAGLGQSERERLARLQPQPKPPPVVPVWHLPTYYTQQPQPQNVEPWFQPDRQLTQDDLKEIARYALSYLASAMRATQPGLWHAGDYMAHTTSARNADSIAGALYPLAKSLPPSAHLSSVPLPLPDPLPDGIVGVTLALNVGAIHLAVRDNQKIVMAFTYDA